MVNNIVFSSKKIFLSVLCLIITSNLWSQVEEKEFGSNNTPLPLMNLTNSSSNFIECKDINILQGGNPNLKRDNTFSPYSYVKLFVNNDLPPFVWFKLNVKLNIVTLNANGTNAETIQKDFEVTYNPNSSTINIGNDFSDLNLLKIENRYGVRVSIVPNTLNAINLATNTSMPLPENVFIQLGFKDKRYFSVSEQIMAPNSNFIYDGTNPIALKMFWDSFPGAEEYELEWTWVDAYNSNTITSTLADNSINFTERDFELNNTRIITKSLEYEIPLIYSKGYLIYRVRPIGRNEITSFSKVYGKWSSGSNIKTYVSDWPQHILVGEYEKNKNWQFQASYAEEGKKKEIVSYFDGSLRNRQTVTKINSDNNAIVGEVIYDSQGRAAIEILPTPTVGNILKYYKNYNLNSEGSSYNYKDFDYDKPTECETSIKGMNPNSGSSRYYSFNNDFKNIRKNHEFIPDAKNYPFSQIEYTPDNTGRISRKGGVGTDHQLGSNHEMQYFYTTPSQTELNRLFGYSVGNATHYKKNIVKDPNGQVSISYLDPQGRTIATALTQGKLNYITELEDSTNNTLHTDFINDLLNKVNVNDTDTVLDNNNIGSTGNFGILNDKLVLSKQIIPIKDSPFTFNYKIKQNELFYPSVCSTKSFPFVYDLNISLKDNCNTIMFEKNQTFGSVTNNLAFGEISLQPETLNLFTKNYTLTKKLSVNKEALETLADEYYTLLKTEGNPCYVNPLDFSPNISIDICNFDCSDFENELGANLNDYLQNRFKEYFNDSSISIISSEPTLLSAPYTNENYPIIIPLSEKFKREREILEQEYFLICNTSDIPIQPCNSNEEILLSDLSPNGQYGFLPEKSNDDGDDIDENSDYNLLDPKFELSIFNINSKLYRNDNGIITTTNNHYQNPITPYLNENNELSYVSVEINDGVYSPQLLANSPVITNDDGTFKVLPQYLANYRDFYANWNNNWSKSLLQYHPEYYYYKYANKICEKTKAIDNVDVNSDQYDSFLQKLTYDKAVEKGYISATGNTTNLILTNDPYFSSSLDDNGNEFEVFSNGFSTRVAIMNQALTSNYMAVDGINLNIEKAALYPLLCNNLVICNFANLSPSSLVTVEQKNNFWKTYVSYYTSLKGKIKHVFSNSYALSKKSYNHCIGSVSTTILGVLTDNFAAQKSIISNAISGYTNDLCTSSSSEFYVSKQKRFIPVDFGFNSGVDSNSALSELVAQNNYEYYANTGNCPRLLDFEIFLNGYFQNNTTLPTSLIPFSGNYLSAELLKDWTGDYTNTTLGQLTSLSNSVTITGNKINFLFSSPGKVFCNDTNYLILNFNSNSLVNWSNYGVSWNIKKFKNLYYDASISNPANKVFKYKAIAVINYNGIEIEVLAEGSTCANIGVCSVETANPDFSGDTLDPNASTVEGSSGCNKRYKFQNALLVLVNKLKSTGQLLNTNEILVKPIAPYLCEFFGKENLKWVYTDNNTFEVRDGNVLMWQFQISNLDNVDLNSLNTFTGVVYDLNSATSNKHKFNLFITLNGETKKIIFEVSKLINFSCCPSDEIIPTFIFRQQTSLDSNFNNKLSYKDVIFQPINFSFKKGELINIEFDFIKNTFENLFETYNHNYEASIKINNKIFDFSNNNLGVKKQSGVTSSLYWYPATDRLSWNYFYPASFNIYSLEYRGSTNFSSTPFSSIEIGSFNRTYIFNQGTGNINPIENPNEIMTISPGSWIVGENGISLNYTRETYWNDNIPFSFEGKQPFLLNLKSTFKLTGDLTYIGGEEQYFGHFMQLDNAFTPNNLPNSKLYQFLIGFTNVKNEECQTCIPTTVAPILADQKFVDYINGINSLNIGVETIENTQENLIDFRNRNYQYFSTYYIQYLTALKDTGLFNSSYDLGYLKIYEFSNTYLNHHPALATAVNQYINYFSTNAYINYTNGEINPNLLSWNDWVNTVFRNANPTICPPKALEFFTIDNPIDNEETCATLVNNINETYSQEAYLNYLQELRNKFKQEYINNAMTSVVENFTESHSDKEYQYTLYYYDQAGNLTQTVSPEGVKRFETDQLALKNDLINNFRNNFDPLVNFNEEPSLQPSHKLKTQYRYNTLNQLVWQSTPDGGETRFAYDELGRIIASQNAKQSAPMAFDGPQKMSYTKYDELGRIIEAGEINGIKTIGRGSSGITYGISDEGRLIKTTANQSFTVNGFDDIYTKTEVTRTVYDENPEVEPDLYSTSLFITNPNGTTTNTIDYNSRNRVTGIFYYDTYNAQTPLKFDNAIFYNYDVHGNVKELVTYYTPLRDYNCDPGRNQANDCQAHLKRVIYNYDLISGNVNNVVFQPNKKDQFIHKYNYDADNRIVDVQTSPDGIIWEKDASYQYYAHGPLSRVEIGNKNVQGIDYAYTLQGWLKSVNGENLKSPLNDMGQDGTIANRNKAKDAFGYTLDYFDKDYKAIVNDDETDSFKPLMISRNAAGSSIKNLYNGNIKQMTTALRQQRETLSAIQKNNYTYDQLNRIKGMTSVAFKESNNGTLTSSPSYFTSYSYDRNGNLKTLNRAAPTSTEFNSPVQSMDNLVYDYIDGTNKLALVHDNMLNTTLFENDLENQKTQLENSIAGYVYDINNSNTHNYIYDEIGQLIEDKSEGLVIEWRLDGKVKKVIKNNGTHEIIFTYDGLGNRIAKTNKTVGRNGNDKINSTLYARDAQGNVLGVYDFERKGQGRNRQVTLKLQENHIYGSSRLGLEEKDLLVYKYNFNCPTCRNGEEPQNIPPTLESISLGSALNIENDNKFSFTPHVIHSTLSFRLPNGNQNISTGESQVPTYQLFSLANTARINELLFGSFNFNAKLKLDTNAADFSNKLVFDIKENRNITLNVYRGSINNPTFNQNAGYYNNKTSLLVYATKQNNKYQLTVTKYSDYAYESTGLVNHTPPVNVLSPKLKKQTYIFDNISPLIIENQDGVDLKINIDNLSGKIFINNTEYTPNSFTVNDNLEKDASTAPYYFNGDTDFPEADLTSHFGSETNIQPNVIKICNVSYAFSDAVENQAPNTNDVLINYNFTSASNNSLPATLSYNLNTTSNTNNVTLSSQNIEISNQTFNTLVNGVTLSNYVSYTTANPLVIGACPTDTDLDGIYDHYEVDVNNITIDTDNDTVKNYLEIDDDGDGVLSKYEGNDPNGDHSPNDAIDTDNDGIPNYLDADDDNDGYATWETFEGGYGIVNAIIPTNVSGNPYSTDADEDGLVNYLDNTTGIYPVSGPKIEKAFLSLIGDKRYELANHLGNVLVVINDKKLPEFNITDNSTSGLLNFNADVLSYNDYYPFGQLVPNRHGNSNAYRYGFNGMEKDDELKGEGDSYFTHYRLLDPRIGRWFSTDPASNKYPEYTPYASFNNNPLFFTDPHGDDPPERISLVGRIGNFLKGDSHKNRANKFAVEKGWEVYNAFDGDVQIVANPVTREAEEFFSHNFRTDLGYKMFVGNNVTSFRLEVMTQPQMMADIITEEGGFEAFLNKSNISKISIGGETVYDDLEGSSENLIVKMSVTYDLTQQAGVGRFGKIRFGKSAGKINGVYMRMKTVNINGISRTLPYIGKAFDMAKRYSKNEALVSNLTSIISNINDAKLLRAVEQKFIEYIRLRAPETANIRNAMKAEEYAKHIDNVNEILKDCDWIKTIDTFFDFK